MAWLVTDRILPPFMGGSAPVSKPSNQIEPVAWRIEFEGEPCGVAVMQAVLGDGGVKEVHSFLDLKRVRSPKQTPLWLKPLMKSLNRVSFSMRTSTVYDTLDNLSSFRTRLTLHPSETPVDIRGRVISGRLKLMVRLEGVLNRLEYDWPADGVLGNELTPSGKLLPLYQGRRWRQEVYNPLSSVAEPLDLIEAEVTEPLRLTHGDQSIDAWRVEYRTSEKTGSTEESRLRAVLYVANDGTILKQEAIFLGSTIEFYRESDEKSQELAGLLELERYATLPVDARARNPLSTGGVSPSESAPSGEFGRTR